MNTYKVIVEDMHCQNCAKKITQALEEKGADVVVSVDLKKKTVTVDSCLSAEEIFTTIEDAGFTPVDLELV